MKTLILAAGYATRLYPLTENFPKPLLEVGGRAILDWLICDLEKCGSNDEYIVVSNHRFAHIFQEWADGVNAQLAARNSKAKVTVVDDGTSTNDTRLGAVRDIQLGIETADIDDDLLVMAGDNLLSFSLCDFIDYAKQKGTSAVMRYYEADTKRLSKSGVAEVTNDGRIVAMEEKPANPKSNWCCPPFYYIVKEDVPKVAEAITAGCGVDAPGSFIAWLCQQTKIYAWEMPGPRYDIGNIESYEAVKKLFEAKQ